MFKTPKAFRAPKRRGLEHYVYIVVFYVDDQLRVGLLKVNSPSATSCAYCVFSLDSAGPTCRGLWLITEPRIDVHDYKGGWIAKWEEERG